MSHPLVLLRAALCIASFLVTLSVRFTPVSIAGADGHPAVVTETSAGGRPAAANAIKGRVEIRRRLPPIEPTPSVGDLSSPSTRRSIDRRRSVVYLEIAPRAAFDDRDEVPRARMDQRNQTFVPHLLAVGAGTVVDFPNSDPTYHNVFSLSRIKPFDLGRYAKGFSKSVRFDRPGIVRVFCDIHSHMSAFILVFGHRFFAVTDEQGNYRIEGVPAGSYTVTAWNESLPSQSRQVVVPETNADVDVNFALGSPPP